MQTSSVYQRDLAGPPAGPNLRGDKRIAVIGAGACGLVQAKYLLAAGFDVTVFEIGSQIGGMWCYGNDSGRSSAYRTLHINTSRGVTRFSDLDFDDATQPFPDHVDMHRYLVAYAKHFGVDQRIRFHSEVAQVSALPGKSTDVGTFGSNGWTVTLVDGSTEAFDAVVVATGHLTRPLESPELKAFTGEYLHAHHYREPQPYVDKRVCVVGVGNSACDIASDVCATARSCVLVARSGVVILPKLMFGRAFTDITAQIQRPWIPRKLRQRLIRALVWLAHGDLTKLGFKKPTTLAHVTSNATVVTDIAYHRITVKQGITNVAGQTITFSDGTSQEFDTLIAATGYEIDLDILSNDFVRVDDNRLELYMRMVPPTTKNLFLCGFFNTDTALNMVFEHQARWVREFLLGNATLPPPYKMQISIDRRHAWYAARYRDSARHTIEEEHIPYLTALRRTLKAAVRRAAA